MTSLLITVTVTGTKPVILTLSLHLLLNVCNGVFIYYFIDTFTCKDLNTCHVKHAQGAANELDEVVRLSN